MLIVNDHRLATAVASGLVALACLFGAPAVAEQSATPPGAVAPAVSVSLVQDGIASTFETRTSTVAQFLDERRLTVGPDDYLSVPRETALTEGLTVVYRSAVPAVLIVGKERRIVRTSAETVRGLLAAQGIRYSGDDVVSPQLDAPLAADAVVRVVRVATWTEILRETIAQTVRTRDDRSLARGVSKTVDPGNAGMRETVVRYVRRNGGLPERTVLASRIVREPHARLMLRGIGSYVGLAAYAKAGFEGTLRIIGSAMRMIATAYTAGCYGCSGVTASGVPAGHGVVAVDPRTIPLGTKLFIPGYGRAVAGDTGGAIVGNRIDLGFDSSSDAMRFGRRPVTVYVLK